MKEFVLLCRAAAAILLLMAGAIYGMSAQLYRGFLDSTVDTSQVGQGEFALFLLLCAAIAFGASYLAKARPAARTTY